MFAMCHAQVHELFHRMSVVMHLQRTHEQLQCMGMTLASAWARWLRATHEARKTAAAGGVGGVESWAEEDAPLQHNQPAVVRSWSATDSTYILIARGTAEIGTAAKH